MTTETRAAFLAAILDNPADDTHRGAYADALRESDDPFDRLHGRFISAGLTLHHTREPEENNEGVFYSAIEEQNATAPAVLAAQIKHLFGWEWGPDLAWTNDSAAPGRVTLRLLPPRSEVPLTVRERRERRRQPRPQPGVVWERGCVAGVRIGFEHWTERAPQLLTLCPIG